MKSGVCDMADPGIQIEIEYEAAPRGAEQAVSCAVKAVLEAEGAAGRYPCVILTDDETIHRCNRDFRGVDRPTDVLSFPADEGEALLTPPDGFLGDIMISVPTAGRQAESLGHSTVREIAFLTVHGMLHLLGYDHIAAEDEELMLSRQRVIMAEVEPNLIEYAEENCGREFSMNESLISEMINKALEAREKAYVPYSGFRVGACLLSSSGKFYLGCNIENAAYSPTNCAERTAVFKAVSEGETSFEALAIASDSDYFTYPCGVCRQVLCEFCADSMPVLCANKDGEHILTTLGALLPMAFSKEDLVK